MSFHTPSVVAALALLACSGAPPPPAEAAGGEAPWQVAEAGCEQGDVYACYDAAGWYSGEPGQYPDPDAEGPDADLGQMVALLESACERGDRAACEWMLTVVLVSPELTASAHVAERLMSACETGDALSCVIAGVVLESAHPDEAKGAYEAGCDAGEPEGCYRAAALELESAPAEARALLARGCSEDDQWGCLEYGRVLAGGIGGRADVARARTVVGWVCARDRSKAEARGEDGSESEGCSLLAEL